MNLFPGCEGPATCSSYPQLLAGYPDSCADKCIRADSGDLSQVFQTRKITCLDVFQVGRIGGARCRPPLCIFLKSDVARGEVCSLLTISPDSIFESHLGLLVPCRDGVPCRIVAVLLGRQPANYNEGQTAVICRLILMFRSWKLGIRDDRARRYRRMGPAGPGEESLFLGRVFEIRLALPYGAFERTITFKRGFCIAALAAEISASFLLRPVPSPSK